MDFIGPLLMSESHEYILVVVAYVSKWIEIAIVQITDTKIVIKFHKKNILCRFSTPRVLISIEEVTFAICSLSAYLSITMSSTNLSQPIILKQMAR